MVLCAQTPRFLNVSTCILVFVGHKTSAVEYKTSRKGQGVSIGPWLTILVWSERLDSEIVERVSIKECIAEHGGWNRSQLLTAGRSRAGGS